MKLRKFRKQAKQSQDQLQLTLPRAEAIALIERGLMNLEPATFTKAAEEMMDWEVSQLAGAKHQANG